MQSNTATEGQEILMEAQKIRTLGQKFDIFLLKCFIFFIAFFAVLQFISILVEVPGSLYIAIVGTAIFGYIDFILFIALFYFRVGVKLPFLLKDIRAILAVPKYIFCCFAWLELEFIFFCFC